MIRSDRAWSGGLARLASSRVRVQYSKTRRGSFIHVAVQYWVLWAHRRCGALPCKNFRAHAQGHAPPRGGLVPPRPHTPGTHVRLRAQTLGTEYAILRVYCTPPARSPHSLWPLPLEDSSVCLSPLLVRERRDRPRERYARAPRRSRPSPSNRLLKAARSRCPAGRS